jgi:hypothetical protein
MGSVVVLGLALVAQLLLLINLRAPRPARNPEGDGMMAAPEQLVSGACPVPASSGR